MWDLWLIEADKTNLMIERYFEIHYLKNCIKRYWIRLLEEEFFEMMVKENV